MGLEHCQKSCEQKSNIRERKLNTRAHFIFASVFKALASYIAICVPAPSSRILTCEVKNMLEHAQAPLATRSPARARMDSPARQTRPCSRGKFTSARARVSFFRGWFCRKGGWAWGYANHHCISEYDWFSKSANRTASYGNSTGTNHTALNV